jgi:hypothetical protein
VPRFFVLARPNQGFVRGGEHPAKERIVTLARSELPAARFYKHTDGSPCFEHEGETWTTGWPLADEMSWRFFRLSDDNLAWELVDRAKGRALPIATLRFDYSAYPNGVLSDVKQCVGKSGWLRVSKLTKWDRNAIDAALDRLSRLQFAKSLTWFCQPMPLSSSAIGDTMKAIP